MSNAAFRDGSNRAYSVTPPAAEVWDFSHTTIYDGTEVAIHTYSTGARKITNIDIVPVDIVLANAIVRLRFFDTTLKRTVELEFPSNVNSSSTVPLIVSDGSVVYLNVVRNDDRLLIAGEVTVTVTETAV